MEREPEDYELEAFGDDLSSPDRHRLVMAVLAAIALTCFAAILVLTVGE